MTELNEKIYAKAVKLLATRMHTTGELFQKLKKRDFEDGEIRAVLRDLEEKGFLDDGKFAEIFVENLKRYKEWGYFGIKQKLRQRLVDDEIAAQALDEYYSNEDELQVAERALMKMKKLGRTQLDKIIRSLQQKGFRSDVIREVTRDIEK